MMLFSVSKTLPTSIAVRAHLSEGVKRDLHERNEYWKQFETPVKEVSTNINNGFLTVQGQEDGVLSYNRVVELILGYYSTQQN